MDTGEMCTMFFQTSLQTHPHPMEVCFDDVTYNSSITVTLPPYTIHTHTNIGEKAWNILTTTQIYDT